jgi:hypothetical protein
MKKSEDSHAGRSDKSAGDYQEKGSNALARIFWMLIGNMILAFLAIGIYNKNVIFSYHDAIYWTTVLLLVIVRWTAPRNLIQI